MQEVFENIIEKMESEYENLKEMYKRTKDMSFYFTFQGVNKAIEIVKKESEKSYHGHFGCNTNGEHERCDGCGLTDCKSRNKIWFGVSDDNNGWIPCSERLPEERDWYLAVFEEVDTGFIGIPYIADYLMGSHTKFTTEDGWIVRNCSDREDESAEYYKKLRCVAWQPLPQPYQPKGE